MIPECSLEGWVAGRGKRCQVNSSERRGMLPQAHGKQEWFGDVVWHTGAGARGPAEQGRRASLEGG